MEQSVRLSLSYPQALSMVAAVPSLVKSVGGSTDKKLNPLSSQGMMDAARAYGRTLGLVSNLVPCIRLSQKVQVDISRFLSRELPKVVHKTVQWHGPSQELMDDAITFVINFDGWESGFTLLNDGVLHPNKDAHNNVTLKISMEAKDLEKFVKPSIVELLGIFKDNDVAYKRDLLKRLEGTCRFRIEHDDGSTSQALASFNGKNVPYCIFSMDEASFRAIASKRARPIDLFLDGSLEITGDMEFAITLQPLFG